MFWEPFQASVLQNLIQEVNNLCLNIFAVQVDTNCARDAQGRARQQWNVFGLCTSSVNMERCQLLELGWSICCTANSMQVWHHQFDMRFGWQTCAAGLPSLQWAVNTRLRQPPSRDRYVGTGVHMQCFWTSAQGTLADTIIECNQCFCAGAVQAKFRSRRRLSGDTDGHRFAVITP